jgi:PAS domain S-box-containing protein
MTTPHPPPRASRHAVKSKDRAVETVPLGTRSKHAQLHDLQVHQAELEQQNEELVRAQGDLAAARDRFLDLFDFAPISYLTLDREGRIVEANLTAAAEFGLDRQSMMGSPFGRFIAPYDADRWHRLTVSAFRQGRPRRIELTLLRQDAGPFHAQVDCRRVTPTGAKAQLRVTLSDVSLRHLAERNRRIAKTGAVARAAERRAVATQLHEDLGQRLGMLKMQLSTLALPPDCRAARAEVHSMESEVEQALVLVRRMSADLHPLMLDNLGLSAALEWLIDDVAARLGLSAELHLAEDVVPVDESLALAVYRLTEMALEHFARHVDAGVSIEVLQRSRDLVLLFQSAAGHLRPGASASALLNMTEAFTDHIHLLGARLELSELPQGTRRFSVVIEADPRRTANTSGRKTN